MNQVAIVSYNGGLLASFLKEDKLYDLSYETEQKDVSIGEIYIGRVTKVAKNLNAAFVDVKKGLSCYLPLKEEKDAIYVSKEREDGLRAGDEIVVQIVKEAIKTKGPTLTTKINLTGDCAVLIHKKKGVSISSKINVEETRGMLKEVFYDKGTSYGYIVRTKASEMSEEELIKEKEHLINRYETILSFGTKRTVYSLLDKNDPVWLMKVKRLLRTDIERVITDEIEVYDRLYHTLTEEEKEKVVFYKDESYPLIKLLGLEKKIKDVLKEKVWLKSGASLMIQPTEALVSIDVNSESSVKKNRSSEDTYFQINCEAAKEIARQLQVRNLSGIIIIDFINMKEKEHVDELFRYMKALVKYDPVKTSVIDMTGLGLMEITRMKKEKPLHEIFREVY